MLDSYGDGEATCWRFLSVLYICNQTLLFATDGTSSDCFVNEKQALIRFKRSLSSDPSGRLSSWNGNKCCMWEGVGCDNATGHVTIFDLIKDPSGSVKMLEGDDLNSSLTELAGLSYLDLSGISFRGSPIPEFIGSMTQLTFLNFSFAGFSGAVPHGIRNLSSLRILDLSNMDSVIDDVTWLSRLSALEHLDLNGLSIREAQNFDTVLLYMIPSLVSLSLSGCKLSNSQFDRTHLDSNLRLSTIQTLDLSWNSFGGDFPVFLQNLTSLQVLDLSDNQLNSSIPVMNNVLELRLVGNRFPAIQDTGVWNLCHIKLLDLSYNDMEGGLIGPSSNASECTQFGLETLILNDNKFSGEIPTSLERFTSLIELYLYQNELTGSIPNSIGNLRSLWELDLSGNQLSGPIPTSFGNLSELLFLDLSKNLLNGHLPDTIGQLSKLQFLDISNNSLSGVVTEVHFMKTSSLKYLASTSNNGLTFKISPNWKPPFQIQYVLLGSCNMKSEFPHWIRTQRSLLTLDLSNTSIYGPLPDWFHDLPCHCIP